MENLRIRILILGASLAVLLVAGIFLLTGTICVTQAIVGLPCPACGSTRAAVLLFTGNIVAAHEYMPLIFLSLAFLVYIAVRHTVLRRKRHSKTENAALLGVLAVYLIVYAVRMFFLFPHTPPMIMNENAIARQILRLLGGF